MAFETIYENYQITINYFVEELQNEGKQTTNGNDTIKINILDMDTMYKYETKINSYEDLDKLPEFMQNLEVISNMICSALKKKSNSVKCDLIKKDDKIILDMIYQAEFFKIPFKIPVLIEPESDNIVFERKLRELQIKNQKLEKVIMNMKTEYEDKIYEIDSYGPFFKPYEYNFEEDQELIKNYFGHQLKKNQQGKYESQGKELKRYLEFVKHTYNFKRYDGNLGKYFKENKGEFKFEYLEYWGQNCQKYPFTFISKSIYNHNGIQITKTKNKLKIQGFCVYKDREALSISDDINKDDTFYKYFYILEFPFKIKDQIVNDDKYVKGQIMARRFIIINNRLYLYGDMNKCDSVIIFRAFRDNSCCSRDCKCNEQTYSCTTYPNLRRGASQYTEEFMKRNIHLYQANTSLRKEVLTHIDITISL
jgi:hypothetical protein